MDWLTSHISRVDGTEVRGKVRTMDRWINEFSVMLIRTPYNNALYDAETIRDELEADLKKLGYMDKAHHVRFRMEDFIPRDKTKVTLFDKALAPIDWEIKLSVPTFEMTKEDAVKIAGISRFRIEQIFGRKSHLLFRKVYSQLGYVKFNCCRKISEQAAAKFEEWQAPGI